MRGIFLDIETTGLDPWKHRTIELAFKIVHLASGEVLRSYQEIVRQPEEVWELRDLESIQVNGFSWEEVQKGKPENIVHDEVMSIFTGLDIARGSSIFICQNPSFDRAFFAQIIDTYKQESLRWPYHWLDFASMYWALQVNQALVGGEKHPEKIALSKDAIAEATGLPTEEKPHRAMNGVEHLLLLYQSVLAAKVAH